MLVLKETGYKQYLVVILAIILAFNYTDGWVLGLLLQNIKVDLSLSDTQLGFLSGIAFALFYSVLGVPIARWADRGNRVTIISITTALWSVMVALCGFAGNFVQLLLVRVGVAVGEAGCVPPAHSLLSDYFPREERPRAIARYMMIGGPLSLVIGYFLGGWLNEFVGWRATFILLGLPGIVMATLARLTLREPRHRSSKPQGMTPKGTIAADLASTVTPESAHQSLIAVCTTLWANKTFRHLLVCVSISYFFAAGINQWQPTFLVRSYGLKTGEIGTWFAVIYGVGSFLGTYWGGEWASRYAAQNERLQLKVMAAVYCSFVLISPLIYLTSNKFVAFAIMGIANLAVSTTNGPLFAMIQTLVPGHMRATALALVYLFANLVGVGFGPLAAGALSDALQTYWHAQSLRYALLALCPGYFFAAWHLWRARLTVVPDVQASLATS